MFKHHGQYRQVEFKLNQMDEKLLSVQRVNMLLCVFLIRSLLLCGILSQKHLHHITIVYCYFINVHIMISTFNSKIYETTQIVTFLILCWVWQIKLHYFILTLWPPVAILVCFCSQVAPITNNMDPGQTVIRSILIKVCIVCFHEKIWSEELEYTPQAYKMGDIFGAEYSSRIKKFIGS